MDSNLRFAVIIPVYNAGEYIADCLDSLIAQSYGEWTAYCVDDGSVDSSSLILDEYKIKDERIKVFHKANGGVASARNYALDRLEDEQWVSFVDADDYISPYMLEGIIDGLSSCKAKNVDYIRLFPKRTEIRYREMGTWHKPSYDQLDNRVVSTKEYFRNENVGGFVASLVVKTSIIQASGVRFVETMRILEDQVFSIECAIHSTSILVHEGDYYYYFLSPDSSTRSRIDRSNDIIRCVNRIESIISQKGEEEFVYYFKHRFLPVKIQLLVKERVKHFFSMTKDYLSNSINIQNSDMPALVKLNFKILRALNRI